MVQPGLRGYLRLRETEAHLVTMRGIALLIVEMIERLELPPVVLVAIEAQDAPGALDVLMPSDLSTSDRDR